MPQPKKPKALTKKQADHAVISACMSLEDDAGEGSGIYADELRLLSDQLYEEAKKRGLILKTKPRKAKP